MSKKYQFYDSGWNDRVRGEPFRSSMEGASRDWRDGWRDCDKAAEVDRVLMD